MQHRDFQAFRSNESFDCSTRGFTLVLMIVHVARNRVDQLKGTLRNSIDQLEPGPPCYNEYEENLR